MSVVLLAEKSLRCNLSIILISRPLFFHVSRLTFSVLSVLCLQHARVSGDQPKSGYGIILAYCGNSFVRKCSQMVSMKLFCLRIRTFERETAKTLFFSYMGWASSPFT